MTLDRGRGLIHPPDRKADGQGRQDDDEPAHGLDADRIGRARHCLHDRQQQRRQDADDIGGLPPAVDARALAVVGRQEGAPGGLGQDADREGRIGDRQPDPQMRRPDARLGEEQLPAGQHQQGGADQQPRPEAAQTRAGLIHDRAHHRVEDHVDQPDPGEGGADHRQGQAQLIGIEFRQGDNQRQAERRERQAWAGEGRQGEIGSPLRCHPAPSRPARGVESKPPGPDWPRAVMTTRRGRLGKPPPSLT